MSQPLLYVPRSYTSCYVLNTRPARSVHLRTSTGSKARCSLGARVRPVLNSQRRLPWHSALVPVRSAACSGQGGKCSWTCRNLADVDQTIEVRPSQPLKAKWLRIELRKVETLPAGAGVFFDHIGQSPITLWQAQEEWGMLETCDMPFHIRIPESVPPSLTLEKGSGIRYELVASVCSKGKKCGHRFPLLQTLTMTTGDYCARMLRR